MGDRREQSADETGVNAPQSAEEGALDATGVYEDEDGIVLYDTENPLAWLQTNDAVVLEEMR